MQLPAFALEHLARFEDLLPDLFRARGLGHVGEASDSRAQRNHRYAKAFLGLLDIPNPVRGRAAGPARVQPSNSLSEEHRRVGVFEGSLEVRHLLRIVPHQRGLRRGQIGPPESTKWYECTPGEPR